MKYFYLKWQDDGENLYLKLPSEFSDIWFLSEEENLAIINKTTLEYEIHKIVGDNETCHGTEGITRDDIDLLKDMIENWVVYELQNRIFYFNKILEYITRPQRNKNLN